MRIWVDADACPKVIKDILFHAAMRTKTPLVLVANHALPAPLSPYITKLQVNAGFDVADNKIAQNVEPGDLVITADIPLADAVIDQGAIALNPRGDLYSTANIKERLSMRNFSTDLRSSGVHTGGPAPLSKKEIQTFANALDKVLTRSKRN
ncbi:MAG: YaiI/YqxD family protein [Gammaproteobacteria bacterium]|nr:YaiI/YqxD family protein [Gammaproteobacteria bacterium]